MGTVLQNIVEKKHYKFIDGEGVTWQEAIRLSTLSLVADGTVTENFYKQIIACVEKYGPYIVFEHNIAMPHTQENADGALKTGVGFMVSKKLIDFGTDEDGEEKKANVFFTLSTTNPDEHLENISQLSTAYWLIMFALPQLLNNNVAMMVVMAVILGAYWAVGSNLTVKPMQELSEGAGFAIAHQQMFGIRLAYFLADKIFGTNGGKRKKEIKKVGEMELPGFFSIFNENMVCTAILMTVFFGIIMAIIGKPYFVEAGATTEAENFVFYCFNTSLNFAVYLTILQLGVRTFVTELTASFQGIADKLLPSSIPGVDCAVCFGFGDSNAVTFGFLAGLCGQIVAIILLIVMHSPTIIICGFVPVFFDNATMGLVANEKGGLKACIVIPFLAGLIEVFGAAFIAGWVGMANYGGYLGMFDWDTVWPMFTVVMRFLGYAGVAIVVVVLLAIPQIEYRMDPEGYFLITEDYDAYLEHLEAKKAKA